MLSSPNTNFSNLRYCDEDFFFKHSTHFDRVDHVRLDNWYISVNVLSLFVYTLVLRIQINRLFFAHQDLLMFELDP
jgi:hypothetical protein